MICATYTEWFWSWVVWAGICIFIGVKLGRRIRK